MINKRLGTWEETKKVLELENEKIFENFDINKLSNYEKRKIIFEYLCSKLKYDFAKLESIRKKEKRDLSEELAKVIFEYEGVCNAIAQYYKLLLEINGIYSACVVCVEPMVENNQITYQGHQLNLVYDEENNIYSFDDITMTIIEQCLGDKYFDYDLKSAHEYGQGIKNIDYIEEKWWILPTEFVYAFFERTDTDYLKFGIENLDYLSELPLNIKSVKNIQHKTI